jgi:hypothetical protein
MRRSQKRRNRPGGGGFGKAKSWAERGKHAIANGSNQPLLIDQVLSLTLADLTGGTKRYRVGMLLDEDGSALPHVLVVDNLLRSISTLTIEQAELWASTFESSEEATLILGWAATWRAEQAGIRGHA